MADLLVEFADLRRLAEQLASVRGGLLESSSELRDVAGRVGHAGLAARLCIVADECGVAHDRTSQGIELLAEACRTVAATFETAEGRLAAGASTPAPTGAGPRLRLLAGSQ